MRDSFSGGPCPHGLHVPEANGGSAWQPSTAVERSVANTTDSTPGFQRGYYDLEPVSCKSLCGGGEEVQARGSFGAWGEQGFEMHTHRGSSQPLLAMGPPRSVPLWWHLARGCLVQPLHPHQIKAEHMHSAWSKPSRVVGQWQEGRQNRIVGIPCHHQPRTPCQHHPARL